MKRWDLGAYSLCLNRVKVMGILNMTPDSFSDGGKHYNPADAMAAVRKMADAGVDIIDIGGQSTRPGSERLDAETEWKRIAPLLTELSAGFNIPLSVDTYHPLVARRAVSLGVAVINDVSGFANEEMRRVAAETSCGCIIMYSDDISASDEDPIVLAREFFKKRVDECVESGIKKERICLDVGVGFGKTREQDLALLHRMGQTRVYDLPILAAASRKRVIGICCGNPPACDRDPGTIAAHTLAIAAGADIIRVHGFEGAVQAAKVAECVIAEREFSSII